MTDRFDPATSDVDVDFLVDFQPDAPRCVTPFLSLKEELERIMGRDVGLIEAAAVRNPSVARSVRPLTSMHPESAALLWDGREHEFKNVGEAQGRIVDERVYDTAAEDERA
ncbi:hypothetical protein [Agromyces laixinhei]|uniref:hypothetical protein n=1 Tax=Agromyces laixinhei TaxID=2585717 RepID=UPI00143D971D|nr:hypothetical protein [Agromyces laixinhei]